MNLLILRTIARLNLHLITLFSVYLLVRGHNAPGGGFIAGLLTASAIVLQALAFDRDYADVLIPIRTVYILASGLLFAGGTGLGAVFFGRPFLTHTFGHFVLPIVGQVELATAVLFDFGVYLVVVGTTRWIILTVAGENGSGEGEWDGSLEEESSPEGGVRSWN